MRLALIFGSRRWSLSCDRDAVFGVAGAGAEGHADPAVAAIDGPLTIVAGATVTPPPLADPISMPLLVPHLRRAAGCCISVTPAVSFCASKAPAADRARIDRRFRLGESGLHDP